MQSKDRSCKKAKQCAEGIQGKSAKLRNNKVKLAAEAAPAICRRTLQKGDCSAFVR
jgi:hypothetical protein